jgi:hypothetical protein
MPTASRNAFASILLIIATASAIPSHAALCRGKKGVLSLREACRRTQQDVDLVSSGSPRIVDATGKEVGLLTSLDFLANAIVLRRVTLPDESKAEWIVLAVTPDGFTPRSDDDAPIHFDYTTANCTGTRFLSAEQYSSISLPTFARPLFREPGKTSGVFARREELVTQQYYGKFEEVVSVGTDPAEACTHRDFGAPPAVMVEGPRACSYNPEGVCVICCGPAYDSATKQPIASVGAPAHEFDPATLELMPPFSLSR